MTSSAPASPTVLNALLRNLPADRTGIPAPPDLLDKRELFTTRPYDGPIPLSTQTIGGIACVVLDGGGNTTVLYLHGGGYRMGSAEAYAPYAAQIAQYSGARIVIASYRLAPETPYPGALRDAASVYAALRAAEPRRPLVIAGDSAGGGLAAALTALTARAETARPDGLALLSPWLDMRCDNPTFTTATDPFFDQASAVTAKESYLQGHDETDELVSPLRADAAVFPPTLVQVGSTETLLGEALSFTQALAMSGVSCELHAVADRGHTWPVVQPMHPDSHAALEILGAFVKRIDAANATNPPTDKN